MMKLNVLLPLVAVVGLGTALATSFASAAPFKPSKTAKRPSPRPNRPYSPVESPSSDDGRPGLGFPHNIHQPFGGKLEGTFRGTLIGILAKKDGTFLLGLRDESNQAEARIEGCGMKLRDVPHLASWIGKKGRTTVDYRSDCVQYIAVK